MKPYTEHKVDVKHMSRDGTVLVTSTPYEPIPYVVSIEIAIY